MPVINIPAKVRFALYLLAILGGLFVQYALEKAWFGDAEVRLFAGISTVLLALAASKTSLSDNGAAVTGTVVSETGETGHIEAHVNTELAARADTPSKRILGKAIASPTSTTESAGGMRAPSDPTDHGA